MKEATPHRTTNKHGKELWAWVCPNKGGRGGKCGYDFYSTHPDAEEIVRQVAEDHLTDWCRYKEEGSDDGS